MGALNLLSIEKSDLRTVDFEQVMEVGEESFSEMASSIRKHES